MARLRERTEISNAKNTAPEFGKRYGERQPMTIGKCPDCGRTARLGKLVGERYVVGKDGRPRKESIPTDERLRCMDCCFGPPMCRWITCPDCGAETPCLSACEVCRAAELVLGDQAHHECAHEIRSSSRRTASGIESGDYEAMWRTLSLTLFNHSYGATLAFDAKRTIRSFGDGVPGTQREGGSYHV